MRTEQKIPSSFYRRAAQIMDEAPDVDFMSIVTVLYTYDRWIAKQSEQTSAPVPKPKEVKPESEPKKRAFYGKRPADRRGRLHYREAVIDGKEYTGTSLRSLFLQLGISDEYSKRPRINNSMKENVVKLEYLTLSEILKNYGSKLESYSAYDFDGQFKTIEPEIKIEPEMETANA